MKVMTLDEAAEVLQKYDKKAGRPFTEDEVDAFLAVTRAWMLGQISHKQAIEMVGPFAGSLPSSGSSSDATTKKIKPTKH